MKNIMQKQPVINVSMLGHVSNGKSSLVKAITGEATQRHSYEKENNVTRQLGYSNAKIYKCNTCPKPQCYQSTQSSIMEHKCNICGKDTELMIHVSFCDMPGHSDFMSTMLNGTCIVDYGILVESVTSNQIPALQTIEHFDVARESKIPIVLVCLNKLDVMLKNKNTINEAIDKIGKFIESYDMPKIPLVPVSGTLGYNIDIVCEYLAGLKVPQKNISSDYRMLIVRSFNINKEKTPIAKINGGVIGGSLIRGTLNVGDEFVIYPGYIGKDKTSCTPLQGKVKSIRSDKNELDSAIPGGMIAVQLDIDSAFTGDDKLVGQVVYSKNKKDVSVYTEISLRFKSLTKKIEEYGGFKEGETVQINTNANNILAQIQDFNSEFVRLSLEKPVCLESGDLISISKIRGKSIDICGYGVLSN